MLGLRMKGEEPGNSPGKYWEDEDKERVVKMGGQVAKTEERNGMKLPFKEQIEICRVGSSNDCG